MKRLRRQIEEDFVKRARDFGRTVIYYPDQHSNAVINWLNCGSLIYKNMKTNISISNLAKIPLHIIKQGIEEIKDTIDRGV